MDKLFLTVLNMSLTGAFVIAAVCLLRLLLRKAPKIITLLPLGGGRLPAFNPILDREHFQPDAFQCQDDTDGYCHSAGAAHRKRHIHP